MTGAARDGPRSHRRRWLHLYREVPTNASRVMVLPCRRPAAARAPGPRGARRSTTTVPRRPRGSCRLGSNQWCDFERNRKCVDRSECVWCYDRLGAHPGGLKVVNLTASHLARKMARRDKRHRRSGRPVVQHDIQKTRFVKNMQRKRPACEATAEGARRSKWSGGRGFHNNIYLVADLADVEVEPRPAEELAEAAERLVVGGPARSVRLIGIITIAGARRVGPGRRFS